ncbi:MAG: hypothetical protein M1511_19630, partial [Deltaproteobacteria bacterium]|nr:hypothetical protein [Deltaproteobacteria bacterium]
KGEHLFKADLQGADDLVLSIESMLQLHHRDQWAIPVVRSEVANNVGIEDIYGCIQHHFQHLTETGLLYQHRRQNLRDELIERVKGKMVLKLLDVIERDSRLSSYISKVENGEVDYYSAADEIFKLIGSRLAGEGISYEDVQKENRL